MLSNKVQLNERIINLLPIISYKLCFIGLKLRLNLTSRHLTIFVLVEELDDLSDFFFSKSAILAREELSQVEI